MTTDTTTILTPPPEANRGRWAAWPTVGLGFAVFSVNTAVQVVALLGYLFVKYVANPSLDFEKVVTTLTSDGLALSIATIPSAIAGVGLIIAFVRLRRGASIPDYLDLKRLTWQAALIAVLAPIVLAVIADLLNAFTVQSSDAQMMLDAYRTSLWPPLLWIAVVVFAPAFEEFFFRGFLFSGLVRSRIGPIGTIALTSIGWAALHVQYSAFGIGSVLVLGIVLGVVRLKTGSLWTAVIMHAVWNVVAMTETYLAVSGAFS